MTTTTQLRDNVTELQNEIKRLAKAKNAVILAHNYERPEVQDVADFVGDSLGLSREAARTDAEIIVFCEFTSWQRLRLCSRRRKWYCSPISLPAAHSLRLSMATSCERGRRSIRAQWLFPM